MAEETNNEENYPLIFSVHLLTAEEARSMYQPEYTLEEILRHIKERAPESHRVKGYEFEKMSKPVIEKLKELGYEIRSGGIGKVEISWE